MSKVLMMLLAAAIAFGFAPTTSTAEAQTVRFGGTIAEVGEASILFRTDRGPVEVHVTRDTRLIRNGQPARLGEFQRGDRAHVLAERTNRGLIGLAIEARSATIELHGTIAEVGERAIVLHTDRGDLRIAVTEHTVITRDGRPARLAQLQRGDRAGVQAFHDGHDGLIARAIHARSTSDVVRLDGVIVELGRGWLILRTDRGDVRVWVTERTRIMRNGEPAHFEDLRVEDHARIAAQWHGTGEDRRLIAQHINARGR